MDTSRTISELKSSFIRSQVRILSAALEPQEDWRAYGAPSEDGDLSDKAVEEALQKCMGDLYAFQGRLRSLLTDCSTFSPETT